jgi:xanthine dehydrogenase accessory factor
MTDAEEVLRQAASWLGAGRRVALATVVETWGSSPRPAGSHLVVADGGELVGSVSGGCVEAAVVDEALGVLAGGAPRLLRFDVTRERAWDVGLACGGTLEVFVQRVGARAELDEALRAVESRRAAVLAIDLATGALRVVDPALGDEAVRAAAASGRSQRCGDAFLRVLRPVVRVVVVGAVHIAQRLAAMAPLAGYEVVVVDPRTAFANEARFPGVPLVRAWPDEALARVGLDRLTAVVTLTHDPKLDDPALSAALRSDAFYVGALGSRTTHAARRRRLAAEGFTQAALDRIHGPVGLPIGASSPGEIAVSILAEVVAAARGGGS